jgi:hypothetical protein
MLNGHQAFFGPEIVENAWWLPNIFWIKEKRESQIMIGDYQTFS